MLFIIQEFITNGAAFRLWQDYWLAVIGFALSSLVATVVLGNKNSRRASLVLKGFTILCAAGALPLAMDRIGLGIAISNHETLTWINMAATGVAILIASILIFKGRISGTPDADYEIENPGMPIDSPNQKATDNTVYPSTLMNTINPHSSLKRILNDSTNSNAILEQSRSNKFQSPLLNKTLGSIRNKPTSAPTADHGYGNGHPTIQLPLQSSSYTIGRGSENALRVDDPKVSRTHAYVTQENGQYILRDNDSTNGTYLDGKKVTSAALAPGSRIQVGDAITIFDPEGSSAIPGNPADHLDPLATITHAPKSHHAPVLLAKSGPAKGKYFRVTGDSARLGRSSANDVQLADQHASRYHAKIALKDGHWNVYHAGGSADTQINGTTITGTSIQNGESFTIGETTLVYHAIRKPEVQEDDLATSVGTIVASSVNTTGTLIAVSGPDAGKQFTVNQATTVIGRGATPDISLADTGVSREHCAVRQNEKGVTLFDLGSSSGTYSESTKSYVQGLPIKNGDTITLGQSNLLVTLL